MILVMQNPFHAIFGPHDDHRRMQEAVVSSRKDVEKAKNRFEDTVRELLKQNDSLTGKADASHPFHNTPNK